MTISLSQIVSAQAVRSMMALQPIDGPGGRIFPPTYIADRSGEPARHVVETLNNGTKRVLVDSVASQANRQEEALVEARSAGRIDFSDVYVDLSETESDLSGLSATEMPHRLSDAILRDSEIDGKSFKLSPLGKSILATTNADLSPILEASPTSVLYGCWFSQHSLPRPLKIQRNVVADVWAENAVLGLSVGGRIDPLGIEKIPLYQAADGEWTALESEAVDDKGKPKLFGKDPSHVNHGNIPPSIHTQGITADAITLRWALPLAAIRRLRFGGDKRDVAGQAYVAALAIVARVLQHEAGYSLRSRCDLISSGPVSFDIIDRDGVVNTVEISAAQAIELLKEAEAGLREAGLKVHQHITGKPSAKLKGLIAANRLQQLAEGEVDA